MQISRPDSLTNTSVNSTRAYNVAYPDQRLSTTCLRSGHATTCGCLAVLRQCFESSQSEQRPSVQRLQPHPQDTWPSEPGTTVMALPVKPLYMTLQKTTALHVRSMAVRGSSPVTVEQSGAKQPTHLCCSNRRDAGSPSQPKQHPRRQVSDTSQNCPQGHAHAWESRSMPMCQPTLNKPPVPIMYTDANTRLFGCLL